jgi:CSLREA domain-containing protein
VSIKSLLAIFGVAISLLSLTAQAATITVNTLLDENATNSECSLREAITAANNNAEYQGCAAGSGTDTIIFTVTGSIVLTSTLPILSGPLSIIGPGAANLTIDAGNLYRFFYFGSAGEYRLEGMSLIDGNSPIGAYPAVHVLNDVNLVIEKMVFSGMRVTPNGSGGVIGGQNASVTIGRSTFLDNGVDDGSAGVILISSDMIVTVEDSTFENNFANGNGVGGVITVGSGGSLTVRRSTFSGNSANDRGGVIAMFAANATVTIESSTFVNNTAVNNGGAMDFNAGTANISNSLFALNVVSSVPMVGDPTININQVGIAVINSLGYNAISDNTGAATTFPAGLPNINKDYARTAASPLNVRINTIDDNGGLTRTHSLQASSPLIDAGSCTGEPYDQRRFSHPDGGRIVDNPGVTNAFDGCDIGAFERGASAPVLFFADGFEDPPNE